MTTTQPCKYTEKDFSRKTVNALKRKGMVVYGATWLPDSKGCYLNGVKGYLVSDNGTGRVLLHGEVRALAEA